MNKVENQGDLRAGLTRRDFTAASISALFVGMGVTLSGCGGSGSSSSASPASPSSSGAAAAPGEKSGTVSANHGHAAVITAAQLQASGAVNLDIQGTSDHTHQFQLSADEVRQIAAGTRIAKTTPPASTAGEYGTYGEHDHSVTFN